MPVPPAAEDPAAASLSSSARAGSPAPLPTPFRRSASADADADASADADADASADADADADAAPSQPASTELAPGITGAGFSVAAIAGASATARDSSSSSVSPSLPDPALAALAADCRACRRCGLAATRQQVVVSRGNPAARLLLIGEAPGAQEDQQGLPFVGKAGQLLDRMLESVGLDSERDAYICNVIKCRPPDNRKPTPDEMATCRPFLLQQIALVDAPLILLAGATALEGVLGIRGGITKLRGQWRAGEGEALEGRWLMPIFHPSYLLRNASKEQGSPKWLTWQDLKEVRLRLDGL